MINKSDKNLGVIQNYILHLTHSSCRLDDNFKKVMPFTPEKLYRVADEYISEDHVDGLGNPENFIPTYGAESSFIHEDKNKEFPEHVVVVANYGPEIGTKTIATFNDIDSLESVRTLLEEIKNPTY